MFSILFFCEFSYDKKQFITSTIVFVMTSIASSKICIEMPSSQSPVIFIFFTVFSFIEILKTMFANVSTDLYLLYSYKLGSDHNIFYTILTKYSLNIPEISSKLLQSTIKNYIFFRLCLAIISNLFSHVFVFDHLEHLISYSFILFIHCRLFSKTLQ